MRMIASAHIAVERIARTRYAQSAIANAWREVGAMLFCCEKRGGRQVFCGKAGEGAFGDFSDLVNLDYINPNSLSRRGCAVSFFCRARSLRRSNKVK